MKLIIAGSRSIKDYNLVKSIVDEIVADNNLTVSAVVSGRAYGVDRLGEQWAEEYGVDIIEMPADWANISDKGAVVRYNQQGKPYNAMAGHLRNEEMAKVGDALILIHDGVSTGSLDMLRRATNHKLQTFKKTVDVVKHTKDTKQRAYEDSIKWAKEMLADETCVVTDTESCGGNKNDEIISIAVVRLYDGKPLLNTLLRPSSDVKFNYYATQVHGIKEENLKTAPHISNVYDELYELTHNRNVLAYNHTSDKRMIEQTLRKNSLTVPDINWYCVMKQFKNFTKAPAVTNLTAACYAVNVKAGNHDALADALATARVVHRISQNYGNEKR